MVYLTEQQMRKFIQKQCLECGGEIVAGKPGDESLYISCKACRKVFKIVLPAILFVGYGEVDGNGEVVWDDPGTYMI